MKAVSLHGKPGEMVQSPLKNREAAAYRSLEEWVRVTLENNSQARDKAAPPAPISPATERAAAATPEPADPFDPNIFNRQMHPKPQ
jgi:hypothetical protein